MLHTLGIGRCVFRMSVSILASLYDGAFLKLTGRMAVPSLCIFISPLNGGVLGFRLINLHLFSVSVSNLQLFTPRRARIHTITSGKTIEKEHLVTKIL